MSSWGSKPKLGPRSGVCIMRTPPVGYPYRIRPAYSTRREARAKAESLRTDPDVRATVEKEARGIGGLYEWVVYYGRGYARREDNPPGALVSKRVRTLEYEHANEPEAGHVVRVHKFRRGVSMRALEDGSVLLFRPDGLPLWEDIPA